MKKMFVLLWPLWVGAGLAGCAKSPAPDPADYNIVVIAGCEYIEHANWNYFLIHKANCTNLIHGHE